MRSPGAQRRLRAAAFLSSFDRFTIPPLLVPIHDALGVSLGATAAVASAYFVTYGLSQPLWGALSDRIGRVRVLRIAVLGGGLASLVAAGAGGLPLLVAARALSGLFFGAGMPTAMTYLGDTVPLARRQQALAVLMASATAGTATATIIGGLGAQLIGWRVVFLLTALLAVPVLLGLRGLPEPAGERPSASLGRQLARIARRPWVIVVMGLALVEGMVIFGALTFVAAALQKDGVGAALAGSAAAGFGIANVLCLPLVTRAIGRVSSPALIAGGALVAAAGLLLTALDTTVLTALLATLALGAGFGFLHTTMQLWATQVHPEGRAVTISLFAGAVFTGGALGSALGAPAADAGNFGALFLGAAAGALLLAGAGSVLRARYLAARPGDREPPARGEALAEAGAAP